MNKPLLLTLSLLLSLRTQAEPFSLPLFPLPDAAPTLSVPDLWQRLLDCLPTLPRWEWELVVQAELSTDTIPLDDFPYDTSRRYAGLVLTIPLYSTKEVERSQLRERETRQNLARTLGTWLEHLARLQQSRRELGFYHPLERRAQQRVAAGVAVTQEQVEALTKTIQTTTEIALAQAQVEQAQLELSSFCQASQRDSTYHDLSRLTQNLLGPSVMLFINRLILLLLVIMLLRPPAHEALLWLLVGGSGFFLADRLLHHHWASLWSVPLSWFLWWPHAGLGFFVASGVFSIFTAAMTPRGVAWHPWRAYRMQIFKGGHRPGSLSEFLLVGGLLLMMLSVRSAPFPYLMNWRALYEAGVVDLAEWRLHRFHWF